MPAEPRVTRLLHRHWLLAARHLLVSCGRRCYEATTWEVPLTVDCDDLRPAAVPVDGVASGAVS